MNCARFARVLAEFHEGKLSAGEEKAANEHLAGCVNCKKLLEVSVGGRDILPEEMRDDLAESILERTVGGPVCPRVEPLLWEFVRREQAPEESHLIHLHLDHCDACRSMAADLALIQDALPEMAEIDPGERFTREIVQITSGLRVERPEVGSRIRNWWNRMVQRPRFALESAYACTLLMVVLFSPLLPFRHVILERIPSAIISPALRYAGSVWAGTQAPLARQAQGIASVAVSGHRALSGILERTMEVTAKESYSSVHEGLVHIGEWRREGAGNLAAFWNQLWRQYPRNRS